MTDSIGRWTLFNLWATWRRPSAEELKLLVERSDEIRSAGIRVISFSADKLIDDQSGSAAVLSHLKDMNYCFEAGLAQQQLLDELKEATEILTAAAEPLSLPMSYLIDPGNRIAAGYRGPLDIDELLDDAQTPTRSRLDRWKRSAPYGGRSIDHPHVRDTADLLEATVMYRIGRRYESTQNIELARY